MQTINFPFLEPPLLGDGWVTLEAILVLLMLWRKAVDRKGVSGALGRYAFPDEASVILRWW